MNLERRGHWVSNMKSLIRSSVNFLFSATLVGGAFAACDLPQKDIGDESDSNASDSQGDECMPGDMMDAPDGCNTCGCDNGYWVCTAIGCDPTASTTGPTDTVGGECQDGDMMDAPDGCNTCFCEGGLWACTEIGCIGTGGETDGGPPVTDPFSNNGVHICDDAVPFDPLTVTAATLDGNDLTLDLNYSGGCAMHLFGSCWDGAFAESFPVQVQMRIAHEDMDDPCEALPTEQHTFDLSSLAEAYNDAYQTSGGTIIINLEGYAGGPIEYTF
jgi:hypothetical protein